MLCNKKILILLGTLGFFAYQISLLNKEIKNNSMITHDYDGLQPELISNDDMGLISTPAWTLSWFHPKLENKINTNLVANKNSPENLSLSKNSNGISDSSLMNSLLKNSQEKQDEFGVDNDDMLTPSLSNQKPVSHLKTLNLENIIKNEQKSNIKLQPSSQSNIVENRQMKKNVTLDIAKQQVEPSYDSFLFDELVSNSIMKQKEYWNHQIENDQGITRKRRQGIAFIKTHKCGSSTLGSILFRFIIYCVVHFL